MGFNLAAHARQFTGMLNLMVMHATLSFLLHIKDVVIRTQQWDLKAHAAAPTRFLIACC